MNALADLLLSDLGEVSAASRKQPLDAVVLGGGPSGLTATRTLAEAGHSIAVLEGGPLTLLTHASSTDLRSSSGLVRALQVALSYSPESTDGRGYGAPVASLGGRGIFWTGAAPRYLPEDFRDWPLGEADLNVYYDWAEREMFVSLDWGLTPLAKELAKRMRQRRLAAEPEPFAVSSRGSVNGYLGGTIGNPLTLLLRSGLFGVDPPGNRPRVIVDAFALRVDLDSSPDVVSVAVEDRRTGHEHSIFARFVVLAAGGYESVRLALTSRLPDESGWLGRGLSDHWFVRAYFPMPGDFYDPTHASAGAVFTRPSDAQPFQIEVHVPGRRFFLADTPWDPDGSDEYSAMVRAFAPVQGRDNSRVKLTAATGPGSYLVHFEPDERDTKLTSRMRAGLEQVRAAIGALDVPFEVMPLGSSNHEAGGLQMSHDRAAGVVDDYGRLWADPRIRVMDASAWPAIGSANPHLTLVAVARRQASMLASEIKEA